VGGQPDGVGGVTPHRLADEVLTRQVGQLGGHLVDVVRRCDDPDVFGREEAFQASAGQLQERGPLEQSQKLFRPHLSTEWPKPRPSPTRHYHGMSHRHLLVVPVEGKRGGVAASIEVF